MAVGDLLPYLLGGGAVTAIVAALRWGRQDARDAVEAATSNVSTALTLRETMLADHTRLRAELAAALAENDRLRVLAREHGLTP